MSVRPSRVAVALVGAALAADLLALPLTTTPVKPRPVAVETSPAPVIHRTSLHVSRDYTRPPLPKPTPSPTHSQRPRHHRRHVVVTPVVPAVTHKPVVVVTRKPVVRKPVVRPTARPTVRTTAHVSYSDPKAYARSVVGAAQFSCLDALWTRESGWRYNAANPSSGAYGIPQALPGSKMASFGSDWMTNPITQIRWGLSYIDSRYGTPCAAWAHSQQTGWY